MLLCGKTSGLGRDPQWQRDLVRPLRPTFTGGTGSERGSMKMVGRQGVGWAACCFDALGAGAGSRPVPRIGTRHALRRLTAMSRFSKNHLSMGSDGATSPGVIVGWMKFGRLRQTGFATDGICNGIWAAAPVPPDVATGRKSSTSRRLGGIG